jgi:hypothetical protein
MFLKPGDTFHFPLFSNDATGTLADADSLPVGALYRNGVVDAGVPVTVTHLATGHYDLSGAVPSGYMAGDVCSLVGAATVGGIAGKQSAGDFVIDTKRAADYVDSAGKVHANALDGYMAPDNAGVAAIKARTDNLTFTAANRVDANALAVGDKSGYSLAATGLDAVATSDVSSDADARSSFPKMVRALFNRFYNAVTQTSASQIVHNDTGAIVSTMSTGDDGTTATKGKSA